MPLMQISHLAASCQPQMFTLDRFAEAMIRSQLTSLPMNICRRPFIQFLPSCLPPGCSGCGLTYAKLIYEMKSVKFMQPFENHGHNYHIYCWHLNLKQYLLCNHLRNLHIIIWIALLGLFENTKPPNSSPCSSRLEMWEIRLQETSAVVKMGSPPAESPPAGSDQPWFCWRSLNHICPACL